MRGDGIPDNEFKTGFAYFDYLPIRHNNYARRL